MIQSALGEDPVSAVGGQAGEDFCLHVLNLNIPEMESSKHRHTWEWKSSHQRSGAQTARAADAAGPAALALEEGWCLCGSGGHLQGVILGVFPPIPSLKYLHPMPEYPT